MRGTITTTRLPRRKPSVCDGPESMAANGEFVVRLGVAWTDDARAEL